MQIRTYNTLAIALATLLAAPLAMAQADNTSATSQNATARQPMTPLNSDISQATFTHLDKNRDGRVSIDEARADSSFKGRFATLDTDHNGYVSSSELGTATSANGTSSTSASGTTTMGNADWSDDASGTGTSTSGSNATSGTNSTGTTNSSTSDQDSSTSGTQSDDSSSTPPKP
jgi:EF hand domain-containing protein